MRDSHQSLSDNVWSSIFEYEFDIFALKPVQSAILGTDVVHSKPIATVDQNDLEFFIPGDSETYIDQDIKLYVRGKIFGAEGKDLDASDFTAGTNNVLNSLFSQCSISLNGLNIRTVPLPFISGNTSDL